MADTSTAGTHIESPLFGRDLRHQMHVGGELVAATGGRWFSVMDPVVLRTLGEVPNGGKVEARQAVDAAALAFPSYSALSGRERSRFPLRLGRSVSRLSDGFAENITAGSASPSGRAAPRRNPRRGQLD